MKTVNFEQVMKTNPVKTQKATFQKGFGYWDTTYYPYGGCFRRAANDFEVEVTEEKYRGDIKFIFGNRQGYSTPQAFRFDIGILE